MSKYARKVDANQSELVKAFKELGCSVFDCSRVAGGFPDLLIGKNKRTVLVEIKATEKSTYTPAQELFMLNWRGSTVVRINDIDGAIRLVKLLDNANQ
jgi:Holliday junction resolvase